jgi:hypothetical protein
MQLSSVSKKYYLFVPTALVEYSFFLFHDLNIFSGIEDLCHSWFDNKNLSRFVVINMSRKPQFLLTKALEIGNNK